ncbi:MAG TPA: AraC family transcriptional regulator [Phenylobacterium sp.]|nr:AraC family transcriptional regulator [Phenylobacterium sp.]
MMSESDPHRAQPFPRPRPGPDAPILEAGGRHTIQLARATSYIEQNLASPVLTPQAVAKAAHVSRSTLYRLFGGSGGVSRYIWRARLSRAWSVLSSPEDMRTIGAIAFDLGFLSEAHFCHAFRNAFGISPGSLRQARGPDR